MRLIRMAVIVALLPVVLVPPAVAHSCAAPGTAEVGQTTALTIGVAAEVKPLVAIDVQVPDGFTLTGEVHVPAWKVSEDGNTLHFSEGRVEPFGCGYVTLRGRADRKGRLVFPITVTAEDGTTARYTAADAALPNAAGLLYVGIDPPAVGDDGTGGGGGSAVSTVAIAVALALALGGLAVAWRRRRRPGAPYRRQP